MSYTVGTPVNNGYAAQGPLPEYNDWGQLLAAPAPAPPPAPENLSNPDYVRRLAQMIQGATSGLKYDDYFGNVTEGPKHGQETADFWFGEGVDINNDDALRRALAKYDAELTWNDPNRLKFEDFRSTNRLGTTKRWQGGEPGGSTVYFDDRIGPNIAYKDNGNQYFLGLKRGANGEIVPDFSRTFGYDDSGGGFYDTVSGMVRGIGDGVSDIVTQVPFLPMVANAIVPGSGTALALIAAANRGDPLAAIAAASGMPGAPSELANVANAARTATQAYNTYQAIESGDWNRALQSGIAATGMGNTELGDTGLSFKNLSQGIGAIQAIQSGDPGAIFNAAAGIARSLPQGGGSQPPGADPYAYWAADAPPDAPDPYAYWAVDEPTPEAPDPYAYWAVDAPPPERTEMPPITALEELPYGAGTQEEYEEAVAAGDAAAGPDLSGYIEPSATTVGGGVRVGDMTSADAAWSVPNWRVPTQTATRPASASSGTATQQPTSTQTTGAQSAAYGPTAQPLFANITLADLEKMFYGAKT